MAPANRPTSTEIKRRRGHPMLWLLMGLFIFALFAGFVLILDWLDPQGSRVFCEPDGLATISLYQAFASTAGSLA